MTGGIAGLELQRPVDVLGRRFHSIFFQIEAGKNQIGLGRLANAEGGLGLGAGLAGVAASIVIFGKSRERRSARGIDSQRRDGIRLRLRR